MQLIDFSYPLSYADIRIYSGRIEANIKGDAFAGVFDSLSYTFFLSASIAMAVATWLIMPGHSPVQAALSVFGSCFNQDFYTSSRHPTRRISQAFVGFFIMYNFVVTIMYSSVVMSLLTAKGEGKAIQNLGDLLKEEYEKVR